MSEITLSILDARRSIHGTTHGSNFDYIIAALAAEPETIEELEAAVSRFIKPVREAGLFQSFHGGVSEEPWDAGVAVVDLAARLVACESTYSSPSREGAVRYHDGRKATEFYVNYRAPDDWRFVDRIECWEALARERRAQRAAMPPLDARLVLYECVIPFIARECRAAVEAGAADSIVDIHARWLLTPRDDLRSSTPLTASGQSPREALLAKLEFMDFDLQYREQQWSQLGECPPGLSPEAAAYRFGAFGRHEIVLYYDLVRHLLRECWRHTLQRDAVDAGDEAQRLRQLRDEWLVEPQRDLHGMTPFYIIERERVRLPVTLSSHEAIVDDDCPLCQMMAEDFGPCFWHLDGCNMDDDFAFSFDRTREAWEEERRRCEQFNREFDERHAAQCAGVSELGVLSSPWSCSHFNEDALDELPRAQAIQLTLIGIGGYVGELTIDLEAPPRGAPLAESLQRHFAHLRAALKDEANATLIEPLLRRFSEALAAVGSVAPELEAKGSDLQRLVWRLGEMLMPDGG